MQVRNYSLPNKKWEFGRVAERLGRVLYRVTKDWSQNGAVMPTKWYSMMDYFQLIKGGDLICRFLFEMKLYFRI